MKQKGKDVSLLGMVCLLLVLCAACGQSLSDDVSVAETTVTTTTTVPSLSNDPSFTATVLSVGEDWLLVEADADSSITGQVRLVIEQTAAFTEGDRITVWHTGQMMPSLPPQLVATRVEIIG